MYNKNLLIIGISIIVFILYWTRLNFDQSGTVKIWDRNNILLYESAGDIGKKTPVISEDFPRHLIDAVIASEDSTFWNNWGVDPLAIVRSLWLNIKEGKVVSGASTITQQLARASIISPHQSVPRSITRKIREILIAVRITMFYSKKEILTMYLNQMYFGKLAYGIQAAASVYFGKDANQLSLAESAYLVGLLSHPDQTNPKESQSKVLEMMVKKTLILQEEADRSRQEDLSFVKSNENIKSPHFVHYVLEKLRELEILENIGINVYTTLDYPVFTLSEDIAKLWVNKLSLKHNLSNTSLILIENQTGEIITMLGGVDYFDSKNAGQVNMTTALRQPGSAMKPVTYAAAFMQGYTPATLIYDVKKVYKTKKGEGFTPNNYDGRYHGLVLAREALASSLNLPAVEMLDRIGIDSFIKVSRDMGITTFTQEDRYDLSLTLGGGEVKLLELTNLYATFARGGEFQETHAIKNIIDDNGKTIYNYKPKQQVQVLGKNGKQIAFLISDILSDSKSRIPGFSEKNPLVLSRPAAVKTGTTTDWHDNWTIGFTPSYTGGVWVGNNDNRPMQDITGVVGAAPIWNQFLEEYLKGKSKEQFVRPDQINDVEICALSGLLPDGLCPERKREFFINGTEPTEISNLHKLRDGKVYVDYPSEVYSWAVENNQQNKKMDESKKTFLDITNPKTKSTFQTAPLMVNNEALVFEVNASSDIQRVYWYLNGKMIGETGKFPFSYSWKPMVGKHLLVAEGLYLDYKKIHTDEVFFDVVEFKK